MLSKCPTLGNWKTARRPGTIRGISEILKKRIRALRLYFPLAWLLSGCALMPPLRATPENSAAITKAAERCLQAEYELRLNYHHQYDYTVTQLRQRGVPLSSLYGKSLASQLLGVTQNDPEAHASAVSAVRLHRAAQGLLITGSVALVGLIWSGVFVMIAADDGAVEAQKVRPLPLALSATGLGLGITSGVLAAVFGKRVGPAVDRTFQIYNAHAEAAGCPSP